MMLMKEEKHRKGRNSQLMPPTTERATSLAAFSYTCLVEEFVRNTLSIAKRKAIKANYDLGITISSLTKPMDQLHEYI